MRNGRQFVRCPTITFGNTGGTAGKLVLTKEGMRLVVLGRVFIFNADQKHMTQQDQDRIVAEHWGSWSSFEKQVRALIADAVRHKKTVSDKEFADALLKAKSLEGVDYVIGLAAMHKIIAQCEQEDIEKFGIPSGGVIHDRAREEQGSLSQGTGEKNSFVTEEMIRDAHWKEQREIRHAGGIENYKSTVLE